MSDKPQACGLPEVLNHSTEIKPSDAKVGKGTDRRKFLGQVGVAASLAAGALASPVAASAQSTANTNSGAQVSSGVNNQRAIQSFEIRALAAAQEAAVPGPPHTTNGDEGRYSDKSGTYSKGLLQDGPGRVNLNAYQTFRTALNSGKAADFEKIILGGPRTLNGPQGGYCFDLEGTDGWQFGNAPSPANQESQVCVPPAPALASAAYGTELIELYWASLLRDVAFTDYAGNTVANQAAQELSTQPSYTGPKVGGQVTPAVLFRGGFPGETIGPYISQFFIQPTFLGQQPISQQQISFLPNVDYMTDLTTWGLVQNGIDTGLRLQNDPQLRYEYNGRSLGAWTHVDVLYQAYFIAYLCMNTIGVPVNPGNPYVGSHTQNGFATFGGPDFAATVAEVATRALKAVWYQKWTVHLRHRPESGGGIVDLMQTGQGNTIQGHVNSNVLNSQALASSFSKYGSYLLSQAFPEGSPTHPAYPTGHGTVGGACITVLKFFFNGNFVLPNPLVPTSDGLSLQPYTGSDAGQMTVNGELNKLGHNVSFGHGIHSGIHWRSDTDSSLILGEAVALSILRDRALTYNEPFSVSLTKFDGTTATITNNK